MSTPQSKTKVVNATDTPPFGWVRLKAKSPTLNILGPLGPEPPNVTAGFGGYEIVNRPRQVGMVIWNGVEPYQLTFSMFLEGFKEGRSVESAITSLRQCAHGTTGEPGTVIVYGIPNLPATDWVIEGLEFDTDSTIRNRSMEIIRQKVTFTLREDIDPEYEKLREQALMGRKPGWTMYKVKKGDTPASIARKLKVSSWFILRRGNPGVITKAGQNLKDGSQIRVPIPKDKTSKKK